MDTNTETERAAFEAYYGSRGGNLDRAPVEWGNGPSAYMWEGAAEAWRLWQAARASGSAAPAPTLTARILFEAIDELFGEMNKGQQRRAWERMDKQRKDWYRGAADSINARLAALTRPAADGAAETQATVAALRQDFKTATDTLGGEIERLRTSVEELRNIAGAKRFARSHFRDDTEFADWATSRARHTLSKIDGGTEFPAPADERKS